LKGRSCRLDEGGAKLLHFKYGSLHRGKGGERWR
jgi:hypothetical protein